MVSVPVFDSEGKVQSQKDIPESFLKAKVSRHAIKEAVVAYLTHQRQGNASTKTRAEVSGSNRKPWKQKGTGRARAGERTSPVWRGGGITFGPRPHDFNYKINQRVAKLAKESALRLKIKDGKVCLIKDLTLAQPKTKLASNILKNLKLAGKTLIVTKESDPKLKLAFRNIPDVELIRLSDLNAYKIMSHCSLVFSEEAFNLLKMAEEAVS